VLLYLGEHYCNHAECEDFFLFSELGSEITHWGSSIGECHNLSLAERILQMEGTQHGGNLALVPKLWYIEAMTVPGLEGLARGADSQAIDLDRPQE